MDESAMNLFIQCCPEALFTMRKLHIKAPGDSAAAGNTFDVPPLGARGSGVVSAIIAVQAAPGRAPELGPQGAILPTGGIIRR